MDVRYWCEGKVDSAAREGEVEPSWVKIPSDLLLTTDDDKLSCIVNAVYPHLLNNCSDEAYLRERAILTPTNEVVETLNNHVVSLLPQPAKEYLSSDSISKSAGRHESYELLYPVKFFNSLSGNNFPQHILNL